MLGAVGHTGHTSRFILVNLFSWRATNPRDLRAAVAAGDDITGSATDQVIADAVRGAAVVVAAWGHHGTLLGRGRQVLDTIPGLMCVGLTAKGHPRHPLYVPAAQPLVPLQRPRPRSGRGARLHDVERLAHAMQASLLPPELPSIPHVNMAALFRPASRHEVGGDFYDVFPIDDRCWGVVIGDVCGKGPEAAARTSCARYSLRAAAIQQPAPSTVLHVVNRALAGQDAPTAERFITALFARLQPAPGGTTVTLSSAGHPLPIVMRENGEVHPVGTPGTLLGVFSENRRL